MVIWLYFSMEQDRHHGHWEDAPHFIYETLWMSFPEIGWKNVWISFPEFANKDHIIYES